LKGNFEEVSFGCDFGKQATPLFVLCKAALAQTAVFDA
jgi:hypothetical protein